jgi:hypothetical protein
VKDFPYTVRIQDGHLGGERVGCDICALDFGSECAWGDFHLADLTELGITASAAETWPEVHLFKPRNPAFTPPHITIAALRA